MMNYLPRATSKTAFIISNSSFIIPKSGFQQPHISDFHRAFFPSLFCHKGEAADVDLPDCQLHILRLVGLALPFAHPVFDGAGLVVRCVADVQRRAGRDTDSLAKRQRGVAIFWKNNGSRRPPASEPKSHSRVEHGDESWLSRLFQILQFFCRQFRRARHVHRSNSFMDNAEHHPAGRYFVLHVSIHVVHD